MSHQVCMVTLRENDARSVGVGLSDEARVPSERTGGEAQSVTQEDRRSNRKGWREGNDGWQE